MLRLFAVALLSLCAAGLERERAAGDPFEGHWISSATDDRIGAAVITRDAGVLSAELTEACGTADCATHSMPIMFFGSESRPESRRGLGMFSAGSMHTHVILRLKDEVLYVDSYELIVGTTFRRHRQSRLVRHVASLSDLGFATRPFPSYLFEQFFGEMVSTPAYYVDPTDFCGQGQNATATAYLRVTEKTSSLMTIRFTANRAVTARTQRMVLTPAGRIRVLVALIAYPETVGDSGIIAWQQAQAAVNGDHAAFAASHGYDKPVVVFDSTNVVLARSEIADPRNHEKVRVALRSKSVRTDEFDVLITIDLDPTRGAGGLADLAFRSIYVGNFGHWSAPLDAVQWRYVANTAYHHEFAHLWGWQHEWSPRCHLDPGRFRPFATSPTLLGWEDLDGDRIPEILDPTPYGRVR